MKMKSIFLSLFTCLMVTVFAGGANTYSDTGMHVTFPESVERIIDLRHHQSGVDLVVFSSEEAEENQYVGFVIQVPVEEIMPSDLEEMFNLMLGQLQEFDVMSGLEEAGILFETQPMENLITGVPAMRLRIITTMEEAEDSLIGDLHFISNETSLIVLATCIANCDSEERINEYTKTVLDTLSFTE